MVDLDKLRDITLEPRERLVILVMNTDDLLILNTDSARAEVDAFEKLLNQSFEATSRAPVDQHLGMHATVTRNREKRLWPSMVAATFPTISTTTTLIYDYIDV